jgi:hypothetical protein
VVVVAKAYLLAVALEPDNSGKKQAELHRQLQLTYSCDRDIGLINEEPVTYDHRL